MIDSIIEQVKNQSTGREQGCLSMQAERLLVMEVERLRTDLAEVERLDLPAAKAAHAAIMRALSTQNP